MSDDSGSASLPVAPAPGTPAEPQAPVSSLQGDAVVAKAQAEAWMGDPSSPYWRGSDTATAAEIQTAYRDLLRAERAGQPDAIGPAHEVDADLPVDAARYDFSGAPGARSMNAFDRGFVDSFLPLAFAAGIGQTKVSQAVGFALTAVNPTPETFRQFARGQGWSDKAIDVCLDWYRAEAARQKGARR